SPRADERPVATDLKIDPSADVELLPPPASSSPEEDEGRERPRGKASGWKAVRGGGAGAGRGPGREGYSSTRPPLTPSPSPDRAWRGGAAHFWWPAPEVGPSRSPRYSRVLGCWRRPSRTSGLGTSTTSSRRAPRVGGPSDPAACMSSRMAGGSSIPVLWENHR